MRALADLREFFLLERAERVVGAYVPAQADRVRAFHAAGANQLAAARELATARAAASAAMLSREACASFLRALGAARDGGNDAPDPLAELQALPEGALDAELAASVRDALEARDPLFFENKPARELGEARRALDRAASLLEGRIEHRSRHAIHWLRRGRKAAVVIFVLYILWAFAIAPLVLPKNLALGRPVTASSRHPGTPEPKGLVDGNSGGTYGVHTQNEESPWVMVDLGEVYVVESMKVHNRGDGWFDDCLPLIAELSEDGQSWAEVARRRTHFDQNPPWEVDARHTKGRYVRLRAARKTYISLSELEVYGHK